jgi:hypothetical protein
MPTPLAAALLTLLAPAPPDAPAPAPPKGPAPRLLVVQVTKDGHLATRTTREVPELRTEARTRVVMGRQETYYVQTMRMVPRVVTQLFALKALRVTDTAGKKIDGELPRLFAKPTLVLMSADGKPIDPYYLRAFKKGQLVLSWAAPPGGAGGAPPARDY